MLQVQFVIPGSRLASYTGCKGARNSFIDQRPKPHLIFSSNDAFSKRNFSKKKQKKNIF